MNGEPRVEEIREHLNRLKASSSFAASGNLSKLLDALVSRHIEGQGTMLKETWIAEHVFERRDFDPRADSIVRTEASKLRQRLQRYYEEEGASDRIRIAVPKGGYDPVIAYLERGSSKADTKRLPVSRNRRVLAAALLCAIAGFGAGYGLGRVVPREGSEAEEPIEFWEVEKQGSFSGSPAPSPDDRHMAYTSDAGPSRQLDLWVAPINGVSAPRQLTNTPDIESHPDFSPTGDRIVFRSGSRGIWIVPFAGGAARMISQSGYYPRFSPDGQWISYSDNDAGGKRALFAIPAGGGEPVRIDRGVSLASCSLWARDGKSIIFLANGKDGPDWWIAPFPPGENQPSTSIGFREVYLRMWAKHGDPSACPSDWLGRDILLSQRHGFWRTGFDPERAKLDGRAAFLFGGGGFINPRVRADNHVLYASGRESIHLLSLNPSTGETVSPAPVQIKETNFALQTSQSEDGSLVAFTSGATGQPAIWTMSLNNGSGKLISDGTAEDFHPILNRKGTRVVFMRRKGSNRRILVADTDTGVARMICAGCGIPQSWTDDEKKVVWISDGKMSILDTATGQSTPLPGREDVITESAQVSPDGQWLGFSIRRKSGPSEVHGYIARFRDPLPAESEWIEAGVDKFELDLWWAAGSDGVYSFRNEDGMRCLYLRRFDANRRALGAARAVRHFHEFQGYPHNRGFLSVSRRRLIASVSSVQSSVWLAVLPLGVTEQR